MLPLITPGNGSGSFPPSGISTGLSGKTEQLHLRHILSLPRSHRRHRLIFRKLQGGRFGIGIPAPGNFQTSLPRGPTGRERGMGPKTPPTSWPRSHQSGRRPPTFPPPPFLLYAETFAMTTRPLCSSVPRHLFRLGHRERWR